jgi:predicted N-formylglutamate amidohydrolase
VAHGIEEAFEIFRGSRRDTPALISCEHASPRLPEPWRWPSGDLRLAETHWTYDIGAAELSRELCAALGASGVLSRFSRLLVDPNRDLTADDLFRRDADGEPVFLNQDIGADERDRRIRGYWEPYHSALDQELARSQAPVLLAIHTFTPVYAGQARAVEVGVLFDDPEEREAELLCQVIQRHGFDTRLNEPYSGRGGMMYAANRHARAHARLALELELRQDLAVSEATRSRLISAIRSALDEILG